MKELEQQIKDLVEQETSFQNELNNAISDAQANALIDELNIVRNKLSEKREELKAMYEQQQVISQTQEQHTGGLKEAIRDIFNAVIPADQFEQLVGPSDFSVQQQSFNQLVEEVVDESNAVLYATIGQQLESKDEKIRELTAKAIGLESELQTVKSRNERLNEENANLVIKNTNLEYEQEILLMSNSDLQAAVELKQSEADSKQREIESLNAIISAKDEEIARLREELSKAPATNAVATETTYKPSANLQYKIADTQSRIKSALEIALEGRQFRGKIAAGETYPTPPDFFQSGGEDTNADTQDNRIHTSEVAENVGESFLGDTTEQQSDNTAVDGTNVDHGGTKATWEEWVEKAISDLQHRVSVFENERGYGNLFMNPPKRDVA